MARVQLRQDSELSPGTLQQVQQIEAAGGNAAVLRATAHSPEMFEKYFSFYYPSHEGGVVEADLKELVRLRIARLNDCFT